jgi:death-on-curing protein
MAIEYLRLEDVLFIHADQIDRFGGVHGLRDPGLLEAALFRPQTGYYKSVIEQAAALWESLSQNHPFIDGNKRVAFAATFVFLSINNVELTASDQQAQQFLLDLYQRGALNYDVLLSWLREHTR